VSGVDQIAALFSGEGAGSYLGEDVTMAQHMLLAAGLARQDAASDALVAAALLHDVGHFHGVLTGDDLMAGRDNVHGDSGADWLSQWFDAAVCEPVRLHVAAKRYLCAVDPHYFGLLSAASAYTLSVQGGPMTQVEVHEFEALPFAADAVSVRRWDDLAKDPNAPVPEFDEFRGLLDGLLLPA
jgi:gamma-butyrobetaine dioxygenase